MERLISRLDFLLKAVEQGATEKELGDFADLVALVTRDAKQELQANAGQGQLRD